MRKQKSGLKNNNRKPPTLLYISFTSIYKQNLNTTFGAISENGVKYFVISRVTFYISISTLSLDILFFNSLEESVNRCDFWHNYMPKAI